MAEEGSARYRYMEWLLKQARAGDADAEVAFGWELAEDWGLGNSDSLQERLKEKRAEREQRRRRAINRAYERELTRKADAERAKLDAERAELEDKIFRRFLQSQAGDPPD